MKKPYPFLFLGAAGVVVLDQWSKWAVVKDLSPYEAYPVIRGFFDLVLVKNRGIAFGILNRPGSPLTLALLALMTLAAVCLLVWWFSRLKDEAGRIALGLMLIIGGAIGNLIDRIRIGEVIDFLDFHAGSLHWPAFNVADSAITVGTLWLAFNILFFHESGKETPTKPRRGERS